MSQRGVVTEVNGAPRLSAEIFVDCIKLQTGQAGEPSQPHELSAVQTPLAVGAGDSKRVITFRGKEIALSSLELKLLWHLAANRDRPCIRRELAEVLWDQRPPDTSGKDALEHLVRRVCKKVEADYKNPRLILSIRKQGYLLHDEGTDFSSEATPAASI